MRAIHVITAILACVAAGCSDFMNPKDSSDQAAAQNATVIEVPGAEAYCDLGDVRRKSERYVTFAIRNDEDKVVCIEKIRSDCECLLAVNPPAQLEPRSVTEIKIRFTAPDIITTYKTRLVLVTDDPMRKYIMLHVHARIIY